MVLNFSVRFKNSFVSTIRAEEKRPAKKKEGYKTMRTTKKFIVSAIIFAAIVTGIFTQVTSASYINATVPVGIADSTGGTGGDTTDGNGNGGGVPPFGH